MLYEPRKSKLDAEVGSAAPRIRARAADVSLSGNPLGDGRKRQLETGLDRWMPNLRHATFEAASGIEPLCGALQAPA